MTVPRVAANISPVLSYYSAVQLIIYKRVLFMATVMVNYYLLDYVRIARQRPIDRRGLEAEFSSRSTFLRLFLFLFFSSLFGAFWGDLFEELKLRVLPLPDAIPEK